MIELVPAEPRVFPVGRLDDDTEGLLVLTNDGDLTQLLTHPRHGVEKAYLAEVEGVPTPAALRALREGVELDDGPTRAGACAGSCSESDDGASALEIVHQRRSQPRWCGACARRSAIRCAGWCAHASARSPIGKLAPGEWRPLTPDEVRALCTPRRARREPRRAGPG